MSTATHLSQAAYPCEERCEWKDQITKPQVLLHTFKPKHFVPIAKKCKIPVNLSVINFFCQKKN